jgi:hypothetical protein
MDKGVAVVVGAVVERSPITAAKITGVVLLALGTWLVIRE